MQLRRLARRAVTTLLALVFLWFLIISAPTAKAQSDPTLVCGSNEYLAQLPVKPPKSPDIQRQVQLVNCSDQVLLGAVNAAHAVGQPLWPAFPQEDTWVMQPFNAKNPTDYSNVLTIDVPPQWYGQSKQSGGIQPNFWVRTGCRYDEVTNRAQCETGDCGGQYDCSSAGIGPPAATTLAEWTFYQQIQTYYIDSPDISAVNGANLTIDISPRGGDDKNPLNPVDFHWLNWNYPLTVHGADLREPGNCAGSATGTFKLTRSEVDMTVDSQNPNYPLFGYVIVDGKGNPTMPNGNWILACLSNCGRYKFPVEAGELGCNATTDPNCYFWDTFCAANPDITYGQSCQTDADCVNYNGGIDYHIACFRNSGPNHPGECEIRGFFNNSVANCNGEAGTKCGPSGSQCSAPTSSIACTNTYGSINPLDDNDNTKYDWADQPIVGQCSDVVFTGNGMHQQAACIGDDTLHKILHGAYSWPNDPQVYDGDAKVYRVVFSPEGRGKAPITGAQALPECNSLPLNYKPAENRNNCSGTINGQNADFAVARVPNAGSQKWQSTGSDWPCFIAERGSGDNGVLCRWNPPPAGNCRPPKTDNTYVTNSACGRIDSGTSLVSGSMTPNSGDPLFLEVSISKVANSVSLPTSLSGCVPAQGAGSWTLVASQMVNSNQGVAAWYKGTSNTGAACSVTVTLASEDPAELKLYDVPKFNGTVETMSTMSGDCNNCSQPYTVSAGMATTAFSSDLQLGAVLQVNQAAVPVTYWDTWLSNGQNQLTCLMGNNDCPRDDGPDFLPGHGPYSGNSDVGHNPVMPGTQYFHRNAGTVNGTQFSWVGLAIYVELNP